MKKTNRTKNLEHLERQLRRQRPKEPNWNFAGLDQLMKEWAKR